MVKQNTQAGFFNVLVGLILATILLGVASYVGYQGMQKSGTENSILSDVEGWKTYRNEQYGFEIKYPSGWQVEDKGVALSEELGTIAVYFLNPSDQKIGGTFSTNITVVVRSIANFKVNNLDEYMALDRNMLLHFWPDTRFDPIERAVLTGGTIGALTGFINVQGGLSLRDRHLVVIQNNLAYIVAGAAPSLEWDKYARQIEDALLTFKFIK